MNIDHVKKLLQDVFAVLKYFGFLFVMLIVGAVTFITVPQANEMLRQMSEERSLGGGFWSLLIALFLWSITLWYGGRLVLKEFEIAANDLDLSKQIIKWSPRLLGAVSYIIIIISFYHAVGSSPDKNLIIGLI